MAVNWRICKFEKFFISLILCLLIKKLINLFINFKRKSLGIYEQKWSKFARRWVAKWDSLRDFMIFEDKGAISKIEREFGCLSLKSTRLSVFGRACVWHAHAIQEKRLFRLGESWRASPSLIAQGATKMRFFIPFPSPRHCIYRTSYTDSRRAKVPPLNSWLLLPLPRTYSRSFFPHQPNIIIVCYLFRVWLNLCPIIATVHFIQNFLPTAFSFFLSIFCLLTNENKSFGKIVYFLQGTTFIPAHDFETEIRAYLERAFYFYSSFSPTQKRTWNRPQKTHIYVYKIAIESTCWTPRNARFIWAGTIGPACLARFHIALFPLDSLLNSWLRRIPIAIFSLIKDTAPPSSFHELRKTMTITTLHTTALYIQIRDP